MNIMSTPTRIKLYKNPKHDSQLPDVPDGTHL